MAMDELKYIDGKFTVNGLEVGENSATTIVASAQTYSIKDNPEWLNVTIDSNGHLIEGVRNDGAKVISKLENSELTIVYKDVKTLRVDVDEIQSNLKNVTVALNKSQYVNPKEVQKTLKPFFEKLESGRTTPFNVLFIGDSITNFQNGWEPDAFKTFPDVCNDKPLCMYNPTTYTSDVWKHLNPGALDSAYRDKQYGGNMKFCKVTDPSVVLSGNFVSNVVYPDGTYNSLGDYGGYPRQGIKEFYFTREKDAYAEFKVPSGSTGFAIVLCGVPSAKYNDTYYEGSTDVSVIFDGEEIDNISVKTANQNARFDYPIEASDEERTVKLVNNLDDKWMIVWGIETWVGNHVVRPINNGLAGNSVISYVYGYNTWIKNVKPDVIFFEVNILNDTRSNLDVVESWYRTTFDRFIEDGIPFVVFITHYFYENTDIKTQTISVVPEKCVVDGDASLTPRYYPKYWRMIIRLCKEYNIPYLNVAQYQYDMFGPDIPYEYYVDGGHLSYLGHQLYKDLIDYALENNY